MTSTDRLRRSLARQIAAMSRPRRPSPLDRQIARLEREVRAMRLRLGEVPDGGVTTAELARLTGASPRTVRRWRHQLGAETEGGKLIFPSETVRTLLGSTWTAPAARTVPQATDTAPDIKPAQEAKASC